MRKLITDVTNGEVGTLLLAWYDRLPKSHAENARITSALLDNGVQVYAANIGPHRLNDSANFLRQINAAMRPSESVSGDHDVV
jgi:DNA invertase Pin-like site-specific DNA recombinase